MKFFQGIFVALIAFVVLLSGTVSASLATTRMLTATITPSTTQAGTVTAADLAYQFTPTTGSGSTRITILLPDFSFASSTTADGAYTAGNCGSVATGVSVTGVTLTNAQCHAQVGSGGTEFSISGVSGVSTSSVIVVTFAAGTLNAPTSGTSTRLTAQLLDSQSVVVDDVTLSMLLSPPPLNATPHPMPAVDSITPEATVAEKPARLAATGSHLDYGMLLGLLLVVSGAIAVVVKLNYRRGVEQLGSSLGS